MGRHDDDRIDDSQIDGWVASNDKNHNWYIGRVRAAVDGDLGDDETVLAAVPASRDGLRLNWWDIRGVTAPFNGIANWRREAPDRQRADRLAFPDAHLMVLVCTSRRLCVYRQSRLELRGAPWALPKRLVGHVALTAIEEVQLQRDPDEGTILFTLAGGGRHWVRSWNDDLAGRFGRAVNAATAGD